MSSRTLTAAIKEDHEEMYEYYDKYTQASGDVDAQERWARQLIWEIARHAVGEEIVVYPLMEQHMGEKGLKLADQDRADHQYVKEKLYQIESMKPGSEEYNTQLAAVMKHLHEHNDSEEQKDLPELEPHLGTDGSASAAQTFSRTKKFVPTRAHPSAPNKPPFETVVGLMTAPLDKIKDAFAKFPTDDMKSE
ncbi:hypothetical protein HDZ31DRAFT_66282 [Schizophyllum fasciatum]